MGKVPQPPEVSGRLMPLDVLVPGTSRHMALVPCVGSGRTVASTGDPTDDRHRVRPLGNTGITGMPQRGQLVA